MLSRIEVVEPPYMRAVVDAGEHDEGGDRLRPTVTGSSSATVSAGPMPGQHADRRPEGDADAAQRRLYGVSATAKPWPSATSVSMMSKPFSGP